MMRAILADDEPLARRALVRMLRAHPDVSVIAECSDGEAVLAAVQAHAPDLVFLDIRMPGLDGLRVAEELFGRYAGAILFVTAHDRHALQAFDLNAVDYLLKPFTAERLTQALHRVRQRGFHAVSADSFERLLRGLRGQEAQPRYLERIPANRDGRIRLLPVASIERIEAMGNYAKIHVGGVRYDIRETLQSLEERLNPECFVRVHRSTILNLDYVREVQRWFRGGHLIVMKDGTQVRLSRYQTLAIEKLTGKRRVGAE